MLYFFDRKLNNTETWNFGDIFFVIKGKFTESLKSLKSSVFCLKKRKEEKTGAKIRQHYLWNTVRTTFVVLVIDALLLPTFSMGMTLCGFSLHSEFQTEMQFQLWLFAAFQHERLRELRNHQLIKQMVSQTISCYQTSMINFWKVLLGFARIGYKHSPDILSAIQTKWVLML